VSTRRSIIGPDLGCLPSSEPWSRLGESNHGPAHYGETGPRPLWASTRQQLQLSHLWVQ
jgi:hypothetical protein